MDGEGSTVVVICNFVVADEAAVVVVGLFTVVDSLFKKVDGSVAVLVLFIVLLCGVDIVVVTLFDMLTKNWTNQKL